MKKKRIGLFAVALVGVLMLTACGNSQEKQGTSSGTGTQNQQGASAGNTGSAGSTDSAGNTGSSAGNTDGSASGTGSDQAPADGTYVPDDQEPAGDVIPDEDAQAAEDQNEEQEDIWSGSYAGESDTLSITWIDDTAIAFSFAQAGISGSASIEGTQAVYQGDDDHIVTFQLSDTVVNVSVSSEADPAAVESPLNGTYVREG